MNDFAFWGVLAVLFVSNLFHEWQHRRHMTLHDEHIAMIRKLLAEVEHANVE